MSLASAYKISAQEEQWRIYPAKPLVPEIKKEASQNTVRGVQAKQQGREGRKLEEEAAASRERRELEEKAAASRERRELEEKAAASRERRELEEKAAASREGREIQRVDDKDVTQLKYTFSEDAEYKYTFPEDAEYLYWNDTRSRYNFTALRTQCTFRPLYQNDLSRDRILYFDIEYNDQADESYIKVSTSDPLTVVNNEWLSRSIISSDIPVMTTVKGKISDVQHAFCLTFSSDDNWVSNTQNQKILFHFTIAMKNSPDKHLCIFHHMHTTDEVADYTPYTIQIKCNGQVHKYRCSIQTQWLYPIQGHTEAFVELVLQKGCARTIAYRKERILGSQTHDNPSFTIDPQQPFVIPEIEKETSQNTVRGAQPSALTQGHSDQPDTLNIQGGLSPQN